MRIAKKEMTVIREFRSKRNKVFLLKDDKDGNDSNDRKYVLKRYRDKKFLKKEAEILEILDADKVNVPEIFHINENHLLMEYIEGKTLLNYILEKESKGSNYELDSALEALYLWLKKFYDVVRKDNGRLIKSDINLRNFILQENTEGKLNIYGLDFENPKSGPIEEDIGRMCAFIICYAPEFSSWKVEFVKRFFAFMNSRLVLDSDLTVKHYHKELDAIEERRDLEIANKVYDIV